ncbi:hypothetical protein J437_LFUL004053 [Ladona fulva]|uniref:Autophagy-related protein 13 n=1 Tax=Ladona fulva TaxID=123851 RepID=A0A8K0JWI5_LADFU|nr:hypothetical protein J437_LFUL004053 [Ladona fulva]
MDYFGVNKCGKFRFKICKLEREFSHVLFHLESMASVKLSTQDKKDLDKFTKFLALKAVQIIIQSRLGEKVSTKCKPNSSGTDWFNLAIRDLPEVASEAKKVLHGIGGIGWDIPSSNHPSTLPTHRKPSVCVEISLRTAEGDPLALEAWILGYRDGNTNTVGVPPSNQANPSTAPLSGASGNSNTPAADHVLAGGVQGSPPPPQRITHSVYNRMGLLLKSLLSVSRVTPAYRLSRRQGPDSYVICYRIFLGEPQIHLLGDGVHQFHIGQLHTPLGLLCLSVAYRTKMTISPQHTGVGTGVTTKGECSSPSIMLKSDHFRPEITPPHRSPISNKLHEKNNTAGLQNGVAPTKFPNGYANGVPSKCRDTLDMEGKSPKGNEKIKMGAFADVVNKTGVIPSLGSDADPEPFSSLLSRPVPSSNRQNGVEVNGRKCPEVLDNAKDKNGLPPEDQDVEDKFEDASEKRGDDGDHSPRSSISGTSGTTPFAGPTASSDLGQFYRECQTAPPLKTFYEQPTLADQRSRIYPSNLRPMKQVSQSLTSWWHHYLSLPLKLTNPENITMHHLKT